MNLKTLRRIFPSAHFENPDILPVYCARHGDVRSFLYSPEFPFVGCAKRFEIEKGRRTDIWNEQLVPWPWFVLLVAKPSEFILEGQKKNPNLFWLTFANCDGSASFQISSEYQKEMETGIDLLKKTHYETNLEFKPDRWFETKKPEEIWKFIRENGVIIS